MTAPPSSDATVVAGSEVAQRAVAPPAVRGWLYDPAEHWWALLVGAPPRST